MTAPFTYTAYRLLVAALTAGIVGTVILGLGGLGPFAGLHAIAVTMGRYLLTWTGTP